VVRLEALEKLLVQDALPLPDVVFRVIAVHAERLSISELDRAYDFPAFDESEDRPPLAEVEGVMVPIVPRQLEARLRVCDVDLRKGTAIHVALEASVLAEPCLAGVAARRLDVGRGQRQVGRRSGPDLELAALDLVDERGGKHVDGLLPILLRQYWRQVGLCGLLLFRQSARTFRVGPDVCARRPAAPAPRD